MLSASGRSTKTPYMSMAGATKSQPASAAPGRRARGARRPGATGADGGRASRPAVPFRSSTGPAISSAPDLAFVVLLDRREQALGRLLGRGELLHLRRPALGVDRAGRVGDEVH